MPLLTNEQRTEALKSLAGWQQQGKMITKSYHFASFLDAIAFINAVAPLSEAANHHPEIQNVYNRVTLHLTTHDAGGLTEKDLALAHQINTLPPSH